MRVFDGNSLRLCRISKLALTVSYFPFVLVNWHIYNYDFATRLYTLKPSTSGFSSFYNS